MYLTADARGHHPEAAAVSWQLGHVKHPKAMRSQYFFGRIERKIGKMLMVDGIELGLFDELQQMWKFEADDAVRLKQNGKSGNEIIDIRNVSEDVISDD